MKYRTFDTPTGAFVLIQDSQGGIRTSWITSELQRAMKSGQNDPKLLPGLSRQIERYFAGRTVDFSKIAVPQGGEFHQACWEACRQIPRGETRTYAQLEEMAGAKATAARAAGQAMRRNPMPVITPCHRVVGANGRLHGFGGSLDRRGRQLQIKAALLRLEGAGVDPA